MSLNSVRDQAREALLQEAEVRGVADKLPGVIHDPEPTLERIINIAESLGGTVSLVVELPEVQPLQQD